jgi:hypothetical protein
MQQRAAAALVAFAVAAALGLAACGGSATDPAGAKTCPELVERSAKVAAGVVAGLRDKTLADLQAENPTDPFGPLTRPFDGFRLRAAQLGCDDGELRRLACSSYANIKPTGAAAEEYLAAFMQTCGQG